MHEGRRAPRASGNGASGFTLIGLMALLAVASIGMLAAERAWSSLLRQDLEDELISRGEQYANALWSFQNKSGGVPMDLEQLLKSKPRHIRRLYPDPMTPDGKWYVLIAGDPLLNPGNAGGAGEVDPGLGQGKAKVGGEVPGLGIGRRTGPIVGVVSRSPQKSFKIYNGRSQYNRWFFTVEVVERRRAEKLRAFLAMLGVHQVPGQTVPLPTPPGQPPQGFSGR